MNKVHKENCLVCNKLTKRSTTKFCSQKCANSYRSLNKIKRGGPPRKRESICCLTCKHLFYPRKFQKFCSRHCMGMARKDEWIKFCKTRIGPRVLSIQSRTRMSLAASKRNANKEYTKGIGGFRIDIGHYVRSTWEANISRVLKNMGISYSYEPDIFQLTIQDRVLHYRPDFKIGNYYLEVKGWWNEKSKLIKNLMKDQYPDINIVYIDSHIYKEIENDFRTIDNWEFKRRRC